MKKSLFLASLLSLFLIGCSSTPIVDVSKPAGPSASKDENDEKDLDLASYVIQITSYLNVASTLTMIKMW